MVLLSRIERPGGQDLRRDFAVEAVHDLLARGAGSSALLGITNKDRGVVIRPGVARLPVRLERIDVVPEGPEQRLVADLRGIVYHLHRLEVPRVSFHDGRVGRVLRCAAHESRSRRNHTR